MLHADLALIRRLLLVIPHAVIYPIVALLTRLRDVPIMSPHTWNHSHRLLRAIADPASSPVEAAMPALVSVDLAVFSALMEEV